MTKQTVNRVAFSILFSCLLSLLALAGGLLFMANAQNTQSLHAEKKLIESGLNALGESLTKISGEYSGWTPFYESLNKLDGDWLYENVASTVSESHNFDLVVLFDANTQPAFAWDVTTGDQSDLSISNPGLAATVKTYVATAPNSAQQEKQQYMMIKGKPALVSFARVVALNAEELLPNDPKPAIAIGYYLSDERIKKLGETYYINGLSAGSQAQVDSIVLNDTAGAPLTILNWTPAKLGTDTLSKILLSLCLMALLPFAASIFLTLRARKQAKLLMDKEQQARNEATEAHLEALQSSKMAQLGNLTATVAHEIRNPLGSVRTSAYVLRRKLVDQRPDVSPLLDRIDKGITRCDATISQLLDYARSREISKSDIALDDWIVKVVTEQSEKLSAETVLECDLSLNDRKVPIDTDRFERVLINLISNASEAMATAIEPLKNAPKIIISTKPTHHGVELSVADNGPGIAADAMEKILNPMFTTKSFGTGLGLSAVANIVEKHGGSFAFANRPEGGAIFTITLPDKAVEQPTELSQAA
jgi:signal transduction histidine kinase